MWFADEEALTKRFVGPRISGARLQGRRRRPQRARRRSGRRVGPARHRAERAEGDLRPSRDRHRGQRSREEPRVLSHVRRSRGTAAGQGRRARCHQIPVPARLDHDQRVGDVWTEADQSAARRHPVRRQAGRSDLGAGAAAWDSGRTAARRNAAGAGDHVALRSRSGHELLRGDSSAPASRAAPAAPAR